MRLVVLDKASLDNADLDFSRLNSIGIDVEMFNSTRPEQVEQRIESAEIIVTNKVVIDLKLIVQAKKLKLICIAATGTNNVDLIAAKEKAIKVCNVSAYATSSVVQHVFMLLTALNTNLNSYQAALKDDRWSKSTFFCLLDYPIRDLSEQTLGIIGYGELGKGVARLARAFGMQVLIAESLVHNAKADNTRTPLKQLLKESDVVSLHCPLTAQSRNLISQAEFELMKPTAILINTARGGIVNEADLLAALQNKSIAGAGLDVLEQEPPSKTHPIVSSDLKNLIVTPHIAWASKVSRQRLLDAVINNIESYLQGEDKNIVNN